MTPINIRAARLHDAPQLAALSGQLGYPTTAADLGDRLRDLLGRPAQHAVFVALDSHEHIVGWIHVGCRDILEAPRCGEIFGLVVKDTVRTRGIGRRLVATAEQWVRDLGLPQVVVRSNAARAESHPFYGRIGYERFKSQHVYRKKL